MRAFKEFLRPVLVLVIICAVTGSILAFVNYLTTPRILANEIAAANAAYFAALPEADSFTEIDYEASGVSAALRADNGSGYVITTFASGYGGKVPAAVSFSEDGQIINVVMLENEETPGMGQKVRDESFEQQFSGMPAENFTIDDIDAVSGATISSRAAVSAVNIAINAYKEITGGGTE